MAIEKVEALLRRVTAALDGTGIQYAVVGGNAVASWVSTKDPDAARSTKNVDILLRRDSLPAATRALMAIDLLPADVLGVTKFVDRDDPSPKRGVHVVIANEPIRAHYEHPAPDVACAVRSADGFLVVDLTALIQMKLLSFRPIDQAHILDLHAVQLLDQAIVESVPADLRVRLDEILRKSDTNP